MPERDPARDRRRSASRRELGSLREQSQFRTLGSPPESTSRSNDYLGLAADPRLKEAVAEAVARAAVGSTGSRLLSGNSPRMGNSGK